MINNPTHTSDTYSSCIDLIFVSQPNLIAESDVHAFLHLNCHNQIIFRKFNLKNYCPLICYCQVWHYQEADAKIIRRAIDPFGFKKLLKIIL